MIIALPFDLSKPVAGEASVNIASPIQRVFRFIAEHFFDNYPKWALEVIDFQPLDGNHVFVGAKAKQIREDNGTSIESIFQVTELEPNQKLVLAGINAPYKQSYLLTKDENITQLTFRFELLELEIFMRPFEKLIRYAIEEGAETTVENIQKLIADAAETDSSANKCSN